MAYLMELEAGGPNIIRMIKWEGLSFLLFLLLLSTSLFILYLKDQKHTQSLQAFFAGLTHELKTPLASIRLQTEVLDETLKNLSDELPKKKKLNDLAKRLVEDSAEMENQLDKILQLSRLERGGSLYPQKINLLNLIGETHSKWAPGLKIDFKGEKNLPLISADPFGLELILRNLFENTLQHTNEKKCSIELKILHEAIVMTYQDSGPFKGEIKKIGKLFYKHNSARGSGIGAYLIDQFSKKMNIKHEVRTSTERQALEHLFIFKHL